MKSFEHFLKIQKGICYICSDEEQMRICQILNEKYTKHIKDEVFQEYIEEYRNLWAPYVKNCIYLPGHDIYFCRKHFEEILKEITEEIEKEDF